MPAEYLKIHPKNPEVRKIEKAVTILSKGGIVIYPTDTIYDFPAAVPEFS